MRGGIFPANTGGMAHPTEFKKVTVETKANLYFDGGVVSHTVRFADGSRKTLGIIRAGDYSFGTDAAENMAIVDGTCRYRLQESDAWITVTAGEAFDVPAKSRFEITVESGVAQYICSFLS